MLDNVGIFAATAILPIVVFSFLRMSNESNSTECQFNKEGYHYRIIKIYYPYTAYLKRIKIYKNAQEDVTAGDSWIKDSVWPVYHVKEIRSKK